MDKKLPARPNLDHLRRQAKTLLASLNQGDEAAARAFREHLPSVRKMAIAKVRKAGLRLADAQSAVARALLKFGKRVVTGNHTLVTFGGPPILDGLTRLDAAKDPWELDYLLTSGVQAGKIQRAVARLVGDRAEFCLAPAGQPRPTRFDGKKGTGWSLSVWRRAE